MFSFFLQSQTLSYDSLEAGITRRQEYERRSVSQYLFVEFEIFFSVQLLCCLCFMLLSILMAILSMAAFNWQAGRFFGNAPRFIYIFC